MEEKICILQVALLGGMLKVQLLSMHSLNKNQIALSNFGLFIVFVT